MQLRGGAKQPHQNSDSVRLLHDDFTTRLPLTYAVDTRHRRPTYIQLPGHDYWSKFKVTVEKIYSFFSGKSARKIGKMNSVAAVENQSSYSLVNWV